MGNPAVSALALWSGINLLLMLVLALNVSRLRIKNWKSQMQWAVAAAPYHTEHHLNVRV